MLKKIKFWYSICLPIPIKFFDVKKIFAVLFVILTSVAIPMLPDSWKDAILQFLAPNVALALNYWREGTIGILLVFIVISLAKRNPSRGKFKMKFEQLWDGDGMLYCKTCQTPADRDLDQLWCPKCRKEVELFDGQEKIGLQEARRRLG